jgi:hypothetical protein
MGDVIFQQSVSSKYTRASCADTDGLVAEQLLAIAEMKGADGVYFSRK